MYPPKDIYPLTKLSHCIIDHVFSFCSANELGKLSSTCQIFQDQSEIVAKRVVLKLLPMLGRNRIPQNVVYRKQLFYLTRRRILCAGGSQAKTEICSRSCHTVSLDTGSRYDCGNLQKPRIGAEMVNVDGNVLVLSSSNSNACGTVEIFNMVEDRWILLKPIPANLYRISVAVSENCVYITGGYNPSGNEYSDSIFKLNVNLEDTYKSFWMDLTDTFRLPNRRCDHASIVYQNKLIVAGGRLEGESGVTATVDAYDFILQTWIPFPNMRTRRLGSKLLHVCDKLLAVGCDRDANGVPILGTIEQFNPYENRWATMTTFPSIRTDFAATATGSKIYLIGGKDIALQSGRISFPDYIDIFDVLEGKWSKLFVQQGKDSKLITSRKHRADGAFLNGTALALPLHNITWV